MDTANFSAKFDPREARLIDRIRAQLLSGFEESKPIKAQLYKLNAYGEWRTLFLSFSLSLVALFRQGFFLQGTRIRPAVRRCSVLWWSCIPLVTRVVLFSSAEALRSHDGPVIAYAAFYSDVEHEVAVVQSRYRITL